MRSLINLLIAIPLVLATIDERDFSASDVIKKDIVILGGGSSGCYSAVRLREGFGKDILVVEKSGRLGGHTETYTDPETRKPYNYGVQSFVDDPVARTYFSRLGVAIGNSSGSGASIRNTVLVDFSTGKEVEGYISPSADARTAAMKKYVELARKLAGDFVGGFWDFLPVDQIPEDLTSPFGEFVTKHDIQAAVPTVYSVTGFGLGDLISTTTLFVMQSFPASLAGVFLGEGSLLTPVSGNNSEIYGKVTELLGRDVMFDSRVVDAERSAGGVKFVVKNSKTGKKFLVKAKRLLVAFAPTSENASPLRLDEQEKAVFSQWKFVRNYASIVRHPSLVPNNSYTYTDPDAVPDNYMVYPQAPTTTRFDHMGDGYYRVLQVGGPDFMADDARENANMCLKRMIAKGTVPKPAEEQDLEWVALGDHGTMGLKVSGDKLKAGFIQDLNALMGHEGTWYTGAAWGGHLSTDIWKTCEGVISRMLEDLDSMGQHGMEY